MDDFIADLDRSLSKVGSSKFWKKKFGDTTLWLSPITLRGQEIIQELLTNADKIGSNVLYEMKRMTLSHSIVGVNETDLRDFRDGPPAFPVKDRKGQVVNVSLDKFLYDKLIGWSAQTIDDVFSVIGDLMETHQKENMSGIKFENAKDPEVELRELEEKVAELRQSLGKPPLVEKPDVTDGGRDLPEQPADPRPQEVVEVPFDPFAAVAAVAAATSKPVPSLAPAPAPVAPAPATAAPAPEVAGLDAVESSPQLQVPRVVQPSTRNVVTSRGERVQAFVASPSVSPDVVDSSAERVQVAPPVINPMNQSRNPRFSRQG